MYFTIFSLTIAVVWVSFFAILISIFRKQMSVLQYFSIYPLLIVLLFCILRMFLPLELPYTVVIESENILPQIQSFLATPLFDSGCINISPAFLLGIIWFAGAVIIAARRTRTYHRFWHLLNFLPAAEDKRLYQFLAAADKESQPKICKIIVHSAVKSPAIVGCIHPVIILPDIDFEDEELLGIFIHEMAHYRHKHHFIKLVTESICICFWWNPLLKKLSPETAHALEMHADKTACAKLTQPQQRKYLSRIIKVIGNINQPNISNAFSCSFVEETEEAKLKQRFIMILGNHYKNKRKYNLIVLACILTIFLLSYSFVLQPHSEPTPADFGYTEPIDKKRYYIIETENGYDFYEYPNRLIDHMENIGEELKHLQVYKSKEEAKKK